MEYNKKLILEDGQEYYGYAFGADTERVCELVFNTSMVGYQEILSDPSYTDQAVVMTYPIIGSYGMADDDYETLAPSLGALIVREYNDEPSNFRSTETLDAAMRRYGIPGIAGVDTRKLTRSIRGHGSRRVLITDAAIPQNHAYAVDESSLAGTPLIQAEWHGRLPLARDDDMGFNIEATTATASFLKANGIRTRTLGKPSEGSEEILDSIRAGYVSYVINTRAILSGVHYADGVQIRRCASQNNITMLTSLDTVRVLLDVLEEVTIGISKIDEDLTPNDDSAIINSAPVSMGNPPPPTRLSP